MVTFMKLFGTLLAFIFPVMLIKAMEAQQKNDSERSKYTALSSLCFGVLIFIIMCFMPNS